MRLGFVTFVLLIATAIFACGDELPSVSDPPIQLQQATEPSAQQEDEERPSSRQQTRPPEAGRSAESSTDSETDEVEKEPPPEDSSGDETAVQEPEREAGETRDAPLDAEVEDAELESEAEPKDLTNVPAVVMEDADVRVRPGLSWRVIGQLGAGEAVVVLNAASGWFRISFGDDREGWIRKPALDLGEIETRWILYAPAPAIVAEWQGEQHGVMGQSADGAEIRLLPMEDELAEMVSAPIDQVTLLADDITVHDLPILIGDETVVFPGDDFRAGQGKILPEASEWMWLVSGELLAHNDESIWRWHPETDEIDFISRPHGRARLSPDGEHLAVVTCVEEPTGCERWKDTLIVSLDGSEPLSFLAAFRRSQPGLSQELGEIVNWANDHIVALSWTSDGQALFGAVALEEPVGAGAVFQTGVFQLLWLDGRVTQFSTFPVAAAPRCLPLAGLSEGGNTWWDLRGSVVVTWVNCAGDEHGPTTLHMNLDGKFERVIERRREFDYLEPHGIDRVRGAHGADALGDSLEVNWSPSGRHALVTSNELTSLWLFDADESRLRPIETNPRNYPESAVWGCNDSGLCWDVSWHADTRLALMWHWGSVSSGGYLIEVSTATASPLTFWSLGQESTLTFSNWGPNGDFLKVLFVEPSGVVRSDSTLWDGLEAPSGYSDLIAIIRADGSPVQFLRSKWGGLRDSWSADGRWLALGR